DEFEIRPQTEMFLIDVPGWAFLEQVGPDTGARLARRLWRRADAATRAEALTKARAHIERALLEIEGGADFAAVARRYSRGINASKGGYWGFISELGLTGRWAAAGRALSELQPGQISSIIETPEGFFLVKAGRRRPGKRISFEQAQPQIERRLVAEQTDRLSAELLGRLRAEATLSDELEQQAFFEAVLAAAPKPAGSSPGR
ncbi:MAG: peptidylprolyl isomerase, partial [Phycisphaerae bacterium]